MHLSSLVPLALAACVSARTLSETLTQYNATLSTFIDLLALPDLLPALENEKNVTILAPNNNAFSNFVLDLPKGTAQTILENPTQVASLLQYHVLNGTVLAANITAMPQLVNTLAMTPNSSVNSNSNGTSVPYVVELVSDNGTALALSGLKQKATVVTANLTYDNGVIHIIDAVMTLPMVTADTAQDLGLTALTGALQAANDVGEALDNTYGVTMFAPVDAAFEAIDSVFFTGSGLSPQQLTDVLEYHIVLGGGGGGGGAGRGILSSDLTTAASGVTTLPSMTGQNLTFRVENGQLFVNEARVLVPDIVTENGVMHLIDSVLNPNNTSARPNPTATTQAPAFSGAFAAQTSLPFTTGVATAEIMVTPASVPLFVPSAISAGSLAFTAAAVPTTIMMVVVALLGASF